MSSASLAIVRHAHPDTVRVTALSVAIAINLAAFVFALRPLAPQIAHVVEAARPATTIRLIEPPPISPPPPDIQLKPIHETVPVMSPAHIPITPIEHAPSAAVTPLTTEPSQNNRPAVTPSVAPPQTMAPGVVSLAYRSSPLRFPVQALRLHMRGTVILRVLVNENGKPVDVVVEQSSGYPLLDRSAREQVLARWQFQPAIIDGHAVKAWARVPVQFALQEI